MNIKYAQNTTKVFLVLIAINLVVGAVFMFKFVYENIVDHNERSKNFNSVDRANSWEQSEHIYAPKLDSLLEVNPKLTLAYIDKLSEVYTNEPELSIYRGVAYFRLDSFQLSEKAFIKSKELKGYSSPLVDENIAKTYIARENYEKAAEIYLGLAKINSSYYIDLGLMYEYMEKYNQALDAFKLAFDKYKDRPELEFTPHEEYHSLKNKIEQLKTTITNATVN